jgi:hypothetical protein
VEQAIHGVKAEVRMEAEMYGMAVVTEESLLSLLGQRKGTNVVYFKKNLFLLLYAFI